MVTQTIYFGTFCPEVPGLGRLPNKHFRGAFGLAKMASVSTLALLAITRSPELCRYQSRLHGRKDLS